MYMYKTLINVLLQCMYICNTHDNVVLNFKLKKQHKIGIPLSYHVTGYDI